MRKNSILTLQSVTLATYVVSIYMVNIIPMWNMIAIPTLVITYYGFSTKDVTGTFTIGFLGTLIIRILFGWPLSLHWSLANGFQPAIITWLCFYKNWEEKYKITHYIYIIISTLVYPAAAVVDVIIYQSLWFGILQSLKFSFAAFIFTSIAHKIIKKRKEEYYEQ